MACPRCDILAVHAICAVHATDIRDHHGDYGDSEFCPGVEVSVTSRVSKRTLSGAADAAGFRLSPLTRALCGALLGCVPLLITLLLSPTHRSPYLIAYPIVILSAWFWGIPGAATCAVVAGAALEHFIFLQRVIVLGPLASGWKVREAMFVAGSVLVGFFTRHAAIQRQKMATAALEQELGRVEAEKSAALAKEHAAELRLENEARALMALDGANAGVWEWDIENNRSKWSNGFYRLHELEVGGPANYDIWRTQVHPDDIERIEAELKRAVEGVGRFFAEYRVCLPKGGTRWVACEATAYARSDGRATRMSGYCGDVTRRKLSDAALLQSEKLAVAGRLSASIAHEVNNPLEAATNLLYLVRQTIAEQASQAYVDEALQQLDRVGQITKQTLSFSRTGSRSTLCRASDLVNSTLRLLRPKLQMANIEVFLEAESDPEFMCSPGEIQQILTNLINNAAEATSGPGKLRIRISDSVDWKSRLVRGVRISVADTGTGMSAETRQKISEPFFTTKDGLGTGLGMWVVSELLDRNRGTLSISSSVSHDHHGTVMSVFFPVGR